MSNDCKVFIDTLKEISDGNGELDLGGKILSFDQKTQEIILKRSQEMKGVKFNTLIAGKTSRLFKNLKKNGLSSVTTLLDTSSGQKKVQLHFILQDQKISFFIKDLSYLQRFRDEEMIRVQSLKEVEALKEMQQSKKQILRITSHELKTPLTPMKLELQMLLEDKRLNVEQRQSVENIHNSLIQFQEILNKLIIASKMETDSLSLNITKINAVNLVQKVIDIFKPVAKNKNMVIKKNLKDVGIVEWDESLAKQIIHNLLDNAFKYSDKGEVTVNLTQQPHFVLISISDTGIGMTQKVQGNLFKPFYQADSSDVRSKGGSGMGLAIVKGIVQAHGGEISVQSKLGAGTTFLVTLPKIVSQKEVGVKNG